MWWRCTVLPSLPWVVYLFLSFFRREIPDEARPTETMVRLPAPPVSAAARGSASLDQFRPLRSLFRYVFAVGEQRSTMALFTARADGRSATPAPLDFCKARLWQVMDASIDLRDPNTN